MEPREAEEVEQIIDLRQSKKKRMKKLKRRRRRNFILSIIRKISILLIVGLIAKCLLILLSEEVPTKILDIYELFVVFVILVMVSVWLDKPRRKK